MLIVLGFRHTNVFTFGIWGSNPDTDTTYTDADWHHWACVYDQENKQQIIYCDGVQVKSATASEDCYGNGNLYIGQMFNDQAFFAGQIAEVRIWNIARTETEIKGDMYGKLTGQEGGLVAYYPLNRIETEGEDKLVQDLAGGNNGTVNGDPSTKLYHGDAVVSTEYSTIGIDPVTQVKTSIMRRLFATPDLNSALVIPDKRIEALDLKWIGNAQFLPTLLGYIEGAPPIPSENLTVKGDLDYNSATAVELTMSEDVTFSWNRSQDQQYGFDTSTFVGADIEVDAGFGVMEQVLASRSGVTFALSLAGDLLNQTDVAASATYDFSDRLELRGSPESGVKFDYLGKRFVPKNVGYAMVISGTADVFITRLKRSQRMVGYQMQPCADIPFDVNTITFLMNPAYTMNGTLDGLVGSAAADDRYYRNIEEMRAQYGSRYPASFYRVQEAYDLKEQIERQDRDRAAYFTNYNVQLVDETSLWSQIDATEGSYSDYAEVSVPSDDLDLDTGGGGEDQTTEEQLDQMQNQLDEIQESLEEQSQEQQDLANQRQEEINSQISNQDQQVHASECFAKWQKKMADLLIRAGKHNIVNTYVWDADGGLYSESQGFANTIENTVGSSFVMNSAGGFEYTFSVTGIATALDSSMTQYLNQTMTKTEDRSKGFSLEIDLSGVEHIGVTDSDDNPLIPGEKVDRYRFMSFYLDGSTQHYQDFFSNVVDPEWLQSNDEEARALRQVKSGKANKTWRIMHRVTYVERPALMGFGTIVPQPARPWWYASAATVQDSVDSLQGEVDELNAKVDQILESMPHQSSVELLNNGAPKTGSPEELEGKVEDLTTKVDKILGLLENQSSTASNVEAPGIATTLTLSISKAWSNLTGKKAKAD
ncbi:LamG-like jellyroll fold domain-containing protein [Moorena producens]|uniref:LamG-like jellyroll fold domain-containing protein n=1 Tax=Moorena producens TaxID=1155739 RepID=UPI003C70A5E5